MSLWWFVKPDSNVISRGRIREEAEERWKKALSVMQISFVNQTSLLQWNAVSFQNLLSSKPNWSRLVGFVFCTFFHSARWTAEWQIRLKKRSVFYKLFQRVWKCRDKGKDPQHLCQGSVLYFIPSSILAPSLLLAKKGLSAAQEAAAGSGNWPFSGVIDVFIYWTYTPHFLTSWGAQGSLQT